MDIYFIIKILHIISIISWMAGILYLPRLFVYHCGVYKNGVIKNKEMDKTFKTMEYKLYTYIMMPAMVVSVISGIGLGYILKLDNFPFWYIVKELTVMLLIIYHFYLNYIRKQFKLGKNKKKHIYFRIFNEVPTVLLIIIVACVVIKF